MANQLDNVIKIMGGEKVFSYPSLTENELVQQIRAGFPVGVIDSIMEQFSLTFEEMVKPLGVTLSIIKYLHKQTQLSPQVSDRLFLLSSILSEATETLGNHEKAARWIHKSNRSLAGDTPLSRIDTSIGRQ